MTCRLDRGELTEGLTKAGLQPEQASNFTLAKQNWVVVSDFFFIFTPKFGEDETILTHIFQMGLKPPSRKS